MIFNTFGNKDNPIMIMLAGSFCPSESMENLYSRLSDDFFVIAPTYNGHHKDGGDFTTRQNEAAQIKDYLISSGIKSVCMIYGQSMGSEVGIELMHQLIEEGVNVGHGFFDGAPCIRLSKAYKAFMRFKFSTMIKILRKKNVDALMNYGIVKKFACGDTESLRVMMEEMQKITPYLSKESIINEVECCYTFDFPSFDELTQHNMHFFYAEEEKACKACLKHVKKAYPHANYRIVSGYGHLTYACRHSDKYSAMLKEICNIG